MARIYEITTIAGNWQDYEVIEVSPVRLANDEIGNIKTHLKSDETILDSLASHTHSVYSMTGLDEAIKQYTSKLLTEHDETGAKIVRPERLRLIYDAFPLGGSVPILRVYPIEGEQIYVSGYDFKNARLPLEEMTFGQEFEGFLDMQFAGLRVVLRLRNFEAEYEDHFGRDLKKSGKIR